MGRLLFLLLFLFFITSCATSLPIGKPFGKEPACNPAPFVQEHGPMVMATPVTEQRDSITAGQTSYAKQNIAFYSDGKNTYANICKPQSQICRYKFAVKTTEGDLNIYRATWRHDGVNKGKPTTYYTSRDYIQKAGSGQVALFTYHSVKRILLPGEPGYEYLQRFKSTRRWAALGFYGGTAAVLAGAVLGANAHSTLAFAGRDALIIGGVCSVITSVIVTDLNQKRNVQKAVVVHNRAVE